MSALGDTLVGASVVDLFSGSGALGIEALSRGAGHVTFVERASASLRVLDANLELLGARRRVTVVREDVFHWLRRREGEPFDVALADPPYGEELATRLVRVFRAQPFARELWVEHPWRESWPAGPDDRTRRYGDTSLTFLPAEA